MRKLKSFKSIKSLRKREFIDLGEGLLLPVKSLNIYDEIFDEVDLIKPPIIEVKCSDEEVEVFKKDNPDVKPLHMRNLRKKLYDYTDENYLKEIKQNAVSNNINKQLKHIELDYKLGKELLWENMGLKNKDDLEGLSDLLFNKLELGTTFYQKLEVAIKAVNGDTIVSQIVELQNMFEGQSSFEVMKTLLEFKEEKMKNEKSK
jgi:hypothetical protein